MGSLCTSVVKMRIAITIAAALFISVVLSHNHEDADNGKSATGLSKEDIISTVVQEVRRKREADANADPGLKKLIKKLGKSSKKSKRSVEPDIDIHKVESQIIRREAEADVAPGNIKKLIKKFKREAGAEADAEPGLKKFIKKLSKGSKKEKRDVGSSELQNQDEASLKSKREAEPKADPGLTKLIKKSKKSRRNVESESVKSQMEVEIETQKIKREAEAEAEPGLKKLKKTSKKSKREVTEDLDQDSMKIEDDDSESEEPQKIESGLKKAIGSLTKDKREAEAE